MANKNIDPKDVAIYIMYCSANNLPFSDARNRVFIFTDRDAAKEAPPLTKVVKLNGLQLASFLEEYYVCGYTNVMVNDNAPVEIEKVVKTRPEEEYGILNRDLRAQMIRYNELRATALLQSGGDAEKLSDDIINAILGYTTGILRNLMDAELALPTTTVDDDKSKIRFGAPIVDLKDQGKWLALFTDSLAAGAYVNKRSVPVVHKKKLLVDYLDETLNSDELDGIMINPGRESFTITKDMIKEFLLDNTEPDTEVEAK